MMMAQMLQSTPSPLRGFEPARRAGLLQWSNPRHEGHESFARMAIKGGGREPEHHGSQHPLLASPVQGEVPFGELGAIQFHRTNQTNSRETSHG